MKNKIILYLFVFTLLILIFQLVNSSKVVSYQAETIEEKKNEIEQLKSKLDAISQAYDDDVYFSLDRNSDAVAYFDSTSIEEVSQLVKDQVYESNVTPGENPLIDVPGFEGKFLINKVKILNHKWLIADFSDGTYWGEILVRYSLRDGKIQLDTITQLIYPKED